MFLKYKIISGVIWNTVNSSATFILSIGTIAVLARLLKPSDFGLFAMVAVATSLLESFTDMGVSAAIISYRDVTDKEFNSLFFFNIAIGMLMTLLLILCAPLVIHYYREPKLYPLLWLLSLNFTIASPGILFNNLMKKEMRFKILSQINIISAVTYSVTTLTYALFFRNIMSFVVGTMVQSTIATLLLIHHGKKLWKPKKIEIKYCYLKRFLSFGLFQMGERIINRLNWNIDYLLIGRFLGAEALGFYSIAYNLMVKPIQKINPIITTVGFPALSEVQNDNVQLRRYFLKMIRYIIYIIAPIYLIFFALSEDLITLLYGNSWQQAVPVLAIFSFLGIFYAIGNPMGNLILAKGRADIGFWLNVSQTVFLFATNYIGVKFGITGVAFSTLLVTATVFFPVGFILRKYLARIGVIEYLSQLYKPLCFAFCAAGAILLLQPIVLKIQFLGAMQRLMISGVVFMIIYLVLLFVLDKKEILFIRSTLKEYLNKKQSTKT